MTTYRYLLCDLLTDRKLATLPLGGVRFDRRLCRPGSLSGSWEATTAASARVGKLLKAYAGRSALWVYRDGALWWGGIPWTVNAHQGARGGVQINVTAATFDSYAHHRRLYADAEYGTKDDQDNITSTVDQGVIIPDLWRTIQSDPRGNIGVVATDQPTGVTRYRKYLASDMAYVGNLIENLGDVIDGPEHTVDVFTDANGNRVKSLRVANQLGSSDDARIVFQRAVRGGGRVVEWDDTADVVDGGTTFQTRGDADPNVGEDSEPLLSDRVDRLDLLGDGWPLLDQVADYPGVTDKATLDGYAHALADQQGGAMPTQGYLVEVGNTGWNPNRLGDVVRLKLSDLWHDSTDTTVRPVGCEVTPAAKGQPEQVKLLLGED